MVILVYRAKMILATTAVFVVMTQAAGAAELVTLTNGYAMRCDHHVKTEDRMRLYTTAGEDSYIEFPAHDIAGFEQAPDLPAPQPPSQAATKIAAATTTRLSTADLNEMLNAAGKEHNLDVDLLASVVKAESGGNAHAVSRAGAQGLMQLMPRTATDLGVRNSFQPDENIRGGSAYLDALLTRYSNNLAVALAAYNAGPEAVDRYHGIPPYHETRAYVARVIHEFNRRVLAREAQNKSIAAAQ